MKMILLGKFNRVARLAKHGGGARQYSALFDPIRGLNRDHCWVAMNKEMKKMWRKKKLPKNKRYILIGKRERYVDKSGTEKQSIYLSKLYKLFKNKGKI